MAERLTREQVMQGVRERMARREQLKADRKRTRKARRAEYMRHYREGLRQAREFSVQSL